MYRRLLFWFSFLLVIRSQIAAQPHLSSAFALESEWTLENNAEQIQPQGMVGCVEADILYCCHRRGFQNKEEGYKAHVATINLVTGEEGDFYLALPGKKANAAAARKYWIRGICVEGNRLFLLTQKGILMYQKGRGGRYEFVKTVEADLPDWMVSDNGQLISVERIPEEGRFVVRRQQDRTGTMDSIFGLELPGPFMLQYDPNGFVKMADGSLYFLASPDLRIEKFAYNGDSKVFIEPHIAGWKPVPEEIVREISAMPYGSARAMYTFFHTKEYSFPLDVHPLCDTVLLLSYHQYDSVERKEGVFTAIVVYNQQGKVLRVEPYTHFFSPDRVIGEEEFPLYYAQRELCLQVTDGIRVIQVVREAPVEWRGKTGLQYADSVERYFVDHTPVIRVRVAEFRTGDRERQCDIRKLGMRTYNGEDYEALEHRDKKAVFIVNNPPQCHDCESTLLAFLNTLDTAACKVFVVFNNAGGSLAKQDLLANVRRHLTLPFVPLFVPAELKDSFLAEIGTPVYPVVLLKEARMTEARIVPNEQIFTEDLTSSTLKNEFVRKFTLFLHRNGGARK